MLRGMMLHGARYNYFLEGFLLITCDDDHDVGTKINIWDGYTWTKMEGARDQCFRLIITPFSISDL